MYIELMILIGLATYYVTRAVIGSHGPFGIFENFRERFPLGGLTTCYVCFSVWVAMALALLTSHFGVTMPLMGFAGAGFYVMLRDAAAHVNSIAYTYIFQLQQGVPNEKQHTPESGSTESANGTKPVGTRANRM